MSNPTMVRSSAIPVESGPHLAPVRAVSSLTLPGCGDDKKIRDLPGGKAPVPSAEEKAKLKADPSRK